MSSGQATTGSLHPFDPLTPQEMSQTAALLRATFLDVTLRFKRIDIQEPSKKDVIQYIEAERLGKPLPVPPPRLVFALFHRLDTKLFIKAIVQPSASKVLSLHALESHIHGPNDVDELVELEKLCMEHPAVLDEIEKMHLPAGYTVCCDPWIYGMDANQESRKLCQCYMYIVQHAHPETNHYSLPCAFSPVFDGNTHQLVRMDYLPTGVDEHTTPTQPWKNVKGVEYAQDLINEPLRPNLKPYFASQPEGPSFRVSGNLVEWQKWRFRVGFNNRDGMVLYNMTFDGRNTFYRLSMSEMVVPYGDPRAPYHRKQAFDAGDVGFGVTANQLQLGCDCLGHIKYFDGYRCGANGQPVVLPNVICLHEQDDGLLYKHLNYRNGTATTVRRRRLVVQMVCTLSNYEYVFAWMLDQAAGIEMEVRATGILSTMPIDNENGLTVPWGTNVGPGVMAANHQHLLSLRIDPAIDGFNNTVIYEESVPLPVDDTLNPHGVGYTSKQTVIKRPGYLTTNVEKNRQFKIRNDSVINAVSRKAVAYLLETAPSQMLLTDPSAMLVKRAAFTTKPIWVTKHQDDELYAAGEFTNQSVQDTGLAIWASRQENVENSDVVIWHTFGVTHNPRPEDFPVMPVHVMTVGLKPSGFFEKNPALDVPRSTQTFNRSVLHDCSAGNHNKSLPCQPLTEQPNARL